MITTPPGPIARRPDWEARLTRAIEDTPPFAWGEADCCTFAARIIRATTGADVMQRYRGRYNTARGALRLIGDGSAFGQLISDELGPPLPAVTLAQRGDVVLARNPQGEATVAICAAARLACQGQAGVEYLPLSAGLMAWRV